MIKAHNLLEYHCAINQKQPCAKKLRFDCLKKVVTDNINFIHSHDLNHRQFKKILKHTDAPHSDMIFYSGINTYI